ncbi:MAG TPA: hypothetical protein VI248_14035 [Kineosporiaceae bacterium]
MQPALRSTPEARTGRPAVSGADRPPTHSRRARAARRRVALAAAVLALLVPFGLALGLSWATTGAQLDAAELEREGGHLLRPLVRLVAVTVDAQSAAVAGAIMNVAAVRSALREVDTAQALVDGALGTSRRWADLRSRVEDLLATAPRGPVAYTRFSTVVHLQTALVTAIGDASGLVLDQHLDASYLLDTALVRAPDVLVSAGRAGDLTFLAERRGPSSGSGSLPSAVAFTTVRVEADAMDEGLRKSFASTTSRSLGPGLLTQLDSLQSAVAQFAPPLAAVGADPSARSSSEVGPARGAVRDAVVALESAALDQFDRLLDQRVRSARDTRHLLLLSTVAGLVAAGVAWVLGLRREPAPPQRVPVDGDPLGADPPDGVRTDPGPTDDGSAGAGSAHQGSSP